MKTIKRIIVTAAIALAINPIVSAQSDPLNMHLIMDSVTVLNPQSGIMFAGQTDDLPTNSSMINVNNTSQGITTAGQLDKKPIIKPHFEQPGLAIQKNNYYDIRILPVITSDYISIKNAEINSYLEIYDLSGKPVFKTMIYNSDFGMRLPSLAKAVYVLVVRGKSQSFTEKITIR